MLRQSVPDQSDKIAISEILGFFIDYPSRQSFGPWVLSFRAISNPNKAILCSFVTAKTQKVSHYRSQGNRYYMALEIERKFLVINDEWRKSVRKSSTFRQGYLNNDELQCSIRVRATDDQAWLNIKSSTIGVTRQEFEYEIPLKDATTILDSLARKPLIEKTRHLVDFAEHTWEIDVFEGENKGLVVTEIELTASGESFSKPSWVGEEVSHDIRYYNTSLSKHPYCRW